MAKIVRFLLILITLVTLSFYLPSLYRRTVEERPLKTMIYFSEVSHDFVIARESIDPTTQQAAMLYYDTRGNALTETEYMQLLPFNNRRKLKLMGLMPDSLDGVALTTDVLKNVKRSMLVADRSFSYGLAPLFESAPERVGVSLPDDIFRIGKKGIEFIDCTTGEVLQEKSARFARAMQAAGFEAPARDIYGIPSVIKRWDSGYFITDRNGRLFRLSMTEGTPVAEPIARPDDKEVLLMSFGDEEDFLAIVVTTDGSSYLMPRDSVSYQRLPLPSFTGKSVSLSGNLFYYFFTLDAADSTEYVVIDKALRPVNRHTLAHPAPDRAFKAADYLLPVRITQSASSGIGLRWGNPAHFLLVNVVLAIVTLLLRRRQGYKLPVLVIDTLLVLLLGLCGMAGAFAIPYRRNDKKENLPL